MGNRDRPFDLIVAGELNPDLILHGEVTPEFGQVEKWVAGLALTIGSSSAIFACGAARLGLRVAFIGKVGQDEFGRFMLRNLETYGIDVSAVIQDPHLHTGLSVILARPDGDRAILTYPGAIPALRLADIPAEFLARGRHLHLASYFLQEALRPDVPALFALAHRAGLTVSLDTNYDPSERWDGGLAEALAQADIFLPNAAECCAIAGSAELPVAVDRLAQRLPLLVVKLGAAGALARRGTEEVTAPSIPVSVVDTVGAGDTFDAGFIYGYLAGWPLARALRLACVCGALSTRAAGGTAAQPTLAEAERFMG